MLHLVRLIVVFSLFPLLRRWGYGLSWQDGVVLTWGALRGAVALVLALLVQDVQGIPGMRVLFADECFHGELPPCNVEI